MDHIIQAALPYVDTILSALMGLLAVMVIAAVTSLQKKIETWLDAHTSEAQRELLHKLAAEGYAYVEKYYKDNGGPQKLNAAINYVLERVSLDKLGITTEDAEAAVQKAWTELDKKSA